MPHRDLSKEELLLNLSRVEGIDPIKALDGMSGQTPLYLKLVKSFAEEQQGRVGELQQLFDAGDWEVLRRHAHSLKSYTAYIGAYDLSSLCAEAEAILGNGPVDKPLIDDICAKLEPMVGSLVDIVLQNDDGAQKIEFNPLKFKQDLIALLPLLEASDFAAEEALQDLLALTEGTEYVDDINTINEYVDDVEYELAHEHTSGLLDRLI